jgi:hypothetical protein
VDLPLQARDDRLTASCSVCGSTRVRRSMARSAVELLVRKLTPFHLYVCRDCEHRGWHLGPVPDIATHPLDQCSLMLSARPVEQRDIDVSRRRWRQTALSLLVAITLGAFLGCYVHGCRQPSVEQGE